MHNIEHVLYINSVAYTTGDFLHRVTIGGLEEVKRNLQEMILYPIDHPEKFEKFGNLKDVYIPTDGASGRPRGCAPCPLTIRSRPPPMCPMQLAPSSAPARILCKTLRFRAPTFTTLIMQNSNLCFCCCVLQCFLTLFVKNFVNATHTSINTFLL